MLYATSASVACAILLPMLVRAALPVQRQVLTSGHRRARYDVLRRTARIVIGTMPDNVGLGMSEDVVLEVTRSTNWTGM